MGRDLVNAPILSDQAIGAMAGAERVQAIQRLFDSYLRTVDERRSPAGQPFFEMHFTELVPPAQPDSTIKLYDIRIRQALQKIVEDSYFLEHRPKAARRLLSGKIWNVTFAKIDQRVLATRTRVAPEDQAIVVGDEQHQVQPVTMLVNTYRSAAPDDPFYSEATGFPWERFSGPACAGDRVGDSTEHQ